MCEMRHYDEQERAPTIVYSRELQTMQFNLTPVARVTTGSQLDLQYEAGSPWRGFNLIPATQHASTSGKNAATAQMTTFMKIDMILLILSEEKHGNKVTV